MVSEQVLPGRYRHYKGGEYTVLFVAEHHETRAKQVVYVCHEKGGVTVRPMRGTPDDPDGWLDEVNLNRGLVDSRGTPFEPKYAQRFVYVGEVDEPAAPR